MLLIVIGVALLAFIIGDFLNSGRSFFGTGTTVAKVDGKKISITDYQRRYEEYNQQLQQSNQKVDAALVQSQVLNDMITEQLLNEEIEALGIVVTDAELTEAMTGKSANPMIVQFANQMGMETPAQLHDFIFNPGKYGVSLADVQPVQAQWLDLEKEVEMQLKSQKLGVLLAGAIQANDLDKSSLASDMSSAATLNLVNVAYSTLPDADFAVSDAEMQARYNEDKQQYRTQEELRKIHYIAVNIAPSQADLDSAQRLIDTVEFRLRLNPGVESVRNFTDLNIHERTVRTKDVDAATRAFLSTAVEGDLSTPIFRGDVHSMTKLLAKRMDVDSLNVDMLQVQGGKAVQDSVLNLLNTGKPFAEVADNRIAAGQQNVWITLLNMPKDENTQKSKEKLLAAGSGYFILDGNDNGALIYKVNEKKEPKQVYDIADISYKVFASDATIDNLRGKLQQYISKNNTDTAFLNNAIQTGYQPVEAVLTAEMPQVNRIESSRKIVQWAFGAKDGAVSPIFEEGNDKMIAASLDEIVPEGYMPLSDESVYGVVEMQVRNSKKGDSLMEKYNGKASDLAGYAKLMNASVDSAVVVTFTQDYIPAVRAMEPKITAIAPNLQQGALYGPVKGEQGLFVYQVEKIEKSSSQLTPEQLADRYSMMFGARAISQQAVNILRENKSIVNNLIDFY